MYLVLFLIDPLCSKKLLQNFEEIFPFLWFLPPGRLILKWFYSLSELELESCLQRRTCNPYLGQSDPEQLNSICLIFGQFWISTLSNWVAYKIMFLQKIQLIEQIAWWGEIRGNWIRYETLPKKLEDV